MNGNYAGFGQNPFMGWQAVDPYAERRQFEKSQIKRLARLIGCAMLLSLAVNYMLSAVHGILAHFIPVSEGFTYGWSMLQALCFTLIPFGIILPSMKRCAPFSLPYCRPYKKRDFVLIVPIAAAIALLANYAVIFVRIFIEGAGYTIVSSTTDIPVTALGTALFILRSALLPAVAEEFAFRGVLMQPLRRYGEWFAIGISAFFFALMHGTPVGFAFAFIVGIAIGYSVVVTGSIWTGVAIHLINNTVSVIFDLLRNNVGDSAFTMLYAVYAVLLLAVGAVCIVLYLRSDKPRVRIPVSASFLRPSQKLKAFFFTLPAALTVIVFGFSIMMSVRPGGR